MKQPASPSPRNNRRRLIAFGVLAFAIYSAKGRLFDAGQSQRDRDAADAAARATRRTADGSSIAEQMRRGRAAAIRGNHQYDDGSVAISGKVVDLEGGNVGEVEVVFRGEAGEESVTTESDGSYTARVAGGTYRAFVRSDKVMSVSPPSRQRLYGGPDASQIDAPDESAMPLVIANEDVADLELPVTLAGNLHGRVVDSAGRPIANAILHARAGMRPVLGTDTVETDASGNYSMQLPVGRVSLEASHPRYGGLAYDRSTSAFVEAGGDAELDITMVAGCVISGKVITHDGKPAGEGALEQQYGDPTSTEHGSFGPIGRIEADGSFRFVAPTGEDGARQYRLRAWPWKAPPSQDILFDCSEGRRYDNVVFQLQNVGADIEGVLVDANGQPVPNAYIDLRPLDDGGIGQQEKTDAEGKWQVFRMPHGRYAVSATAPGLGIVQADVNSPQTNIKLQLSGTGRVEGKVALENGSFMMRASCEEARTTEERILVTVRDHRFAVDGIPACNATFQFFWHGHDWESANIAVPANGVAKIEIGIGPPQAITVTGTVTGPDGKPVAGARIEAFLDDASDGTATTDANGKYSLRTHNSNVTLVARDDAGHSTRYSIDVTGDTTIDLRFDRGRVIVTDTVVEIDDSGDDHSHDDYRVDDGDEGDSSDDDE